MSNYLITGATGFVGSNIARTLLEAKNNIYIICRKSSSFHYMDDIKKNISIFEYDGNINNLIDYLKEVRPLAVFHLASLFLSTHKFTDIHNLIDSNILFGTQLLEAMTLAEVKYFINTSTSWQHYNNRLYDPVCLYAATKEAFEKILKYYTSTQQINAITLELFDTYGRGDQRKKLMFLLKEASRTGKELKMSPGDQELDLVYIDDVVSAFLCALNLLRNDNLTEDKYTVTSGRVLKLKKIVQIYSQISRKKLKILWGGREYRKREIMKTWKEYTLLPNWKPRVTLEEGIRKIENL